MKLRNSAILSLMMLGLSGCIAPYGEPTPPPAAPAPTTDFSQNAVANEVANWLGVSAETAGTIVERVFRDLGEPNGYIFGEEASGAIGPGLRYGRGTMAYGGQHVGVYWQGPTIGWDLGGNASKTFTLVYNLPQAEDIYRRYPGVEGSAYLVGGVGVNYQNSGDGVTLVPMRAGVGARLGANIGYLAYSREQRLNPF